MLLVKKSDGTYRPVIDYWSINKVTKFDGEPIPNPEYIFAKLGSARYLTKLDFTKGYWQIPKKKSDREITAFSTSLGHCVTAVQVYAICICNYICHLYIQVYAAK